jgi:hypothetical protein
VWFRCKCPVSEEQRSWLEYRMGWLAEQFGMDRLRDVRVILPSVEFFPDPYHGTEQDVRRLLPRVCEYMGVDLGRVCLGFYSEQEPDLGEQFRPEGSSRGTVGLYSGGSDTRILIETSRLSDPLSVVATLAHELGHVHLLGDGRISRDTEDHEPLTDLLTVFMGMGLFTANAVLRESREAELRSTRWQLRRQGYLSMPMYGYALSLFAWLRGESRPAWARYLRPDVRVPFQQGLRFLSRRGTSGFGDESDHSALAGD